MISLTIPQALKLRDLLNTLPTDGYRVKLDQNDDFSVEVKVIDIDGRNLASAVIPD